MAFNGPKEVVRGGKEKTQGTRPRREISEMFGDRNKGPSEDQPVQHDYGCATALCRSPIRNPYKILI
jgi:hypothetical protein